jgi:hypothetical protein
MIDPEVLGPFYLEQALASHSMVHQDADNGRTYILTKSMMTMTISCPILMEPFNNSNIIQA